MGAKVGVQSVGKDEHLPTPRCKGTPLILSCLPLGSETGIDHQGGAVTFAHLPAAVYPDLPAGETHPELSNRGAPAPVHLPFPGLCHIPGGHRE